MNGVSCDCDSGGASDWICMPGIVLAYLRRRRSSNVQKMSTSQSMDSDLRSPLPPFAAAPASMLHSDDTGIGFTNFWMRSC